MPERQIPWRQLAGRLAGTLRVKTGSLQSRFELRAEVRGIAVSVLGASSLYGGSTTIVATAKQALDVGLYLGRTHSPLPWYRRFLLRDVVLQDSVFDLEWTINARREAHAQIILSQEIRRMLLAVPAHTRRASYASETTRDFYDYRLKGRTLTSCSPNFEGDIERFAAAIEAAVALAQRPAALLKEWQGLAVSLDGRFELKKTFRIDGSSRIRFPAQGRLVTVSPCISRENKRDRLVTRIACEYSGPNQTTTFRYRPGAPVHHQTHADLINSAMLDLGCVLLQGTRNSVSIDLEGNVTDLNRILGAANVTTTLARGSETATGPYR